MIRIYRAMYLNEMDHINKIISLSYRYKTPCVDKYPIPLVPLHQAVETRNVEAVKALLYSGANPNERDNRMLTPLHIACSPLNKEGMKELLKHELARDDITAYEQAVIQASVDLWNLNIFRMLLKHRMESNNRVNNKSLRKRPSCAKSHYPDEVTDSVLKTKLLDGFIESRDSEIEIIQLLIEYGSDVDAINEFNKTPIHYAVRDIHLTKAVELLLTHGASASTPDRGNNTPIHEAVKAGNEKAIYHLIRYGADTNASNLCGVTPLHISLRSLSYNYNIIKTLLDNGANVNYRNSILGYSALHIAINNPVTIELLLDYGADINIMNYNKDTPLTSAIKVGACRNDIYNSLVSRVILSEHLNPNIKTDEGFMKNMFFIDSFSGLKAIKYNCDDEISRLKSFNLHKTFSIADFLNSDNGKLLERLVGNNNVNDSLLDEFPIYGKLLAHNMNKARTRSALIYESIKVIDILSKENASTSWCSIPTEIKFHILRLLDDENLYNIIASC